MAGGTREPTGADDTDGRRAWLMVAAGFVSLVVIWGMTFSFSVVAEPLAREVGLARSTISTLYSAQLFTFYLFGGLAGLFVARLPIRHVAVGVSAATVAGVGLLQVVGSYLGLLAAFCLLGTSFGALFTLILSVVPLWFTERRGLATGVLLTGNGIGLQVMPPTLAWLIEGYGVRPAFLAVGALATVVFVFVSGVLDRPTRFALDRTAEVGRAWLVDLLSRRQFWVAFVGMSLVWSYYFALTSFAVEFLTASGLTLTVASGVFGLVGGVSIFSRVGVGAIADRVGKRTTIVACLLLVAASFGLLAAVRSLPIIYLTFVLFGVGSGGAAALYAPIVIEGFDPENSTAILGVFHSAEALSGLLAPAAVVFLLDVTGTYTVPLAVVGASTVVGAVLFWAGTGTDVTTGAAVGSD